MTKPSQVRAHPKIKIIGHGLDDLGQRYYKVDITGSRRKLPLYSAVDLLDKNRIFTDLAETGYLLIRPSSQRVVLEQLERYRHKNNDQFSVVSRLGFHSTFYVRPRSITGHRPHRVESALSTLDPQMLSKYRCRGSLKRWNEQIGDLCVGNSRLMFGASLAFTGPILPLVDGPRNGGFQITGPAETGKTTVAMIVGSIWGCHRDTVRADKGFAESWNTTTNQLEQTARAHCHSVFVLDETGLAGRTPKDAAATILEAVFRLSEGSQKARYNETKMVPAWQFYFLSTSNLTLDQLAEQGNLSIDDQHRGRLVDVVLPRGQGHFGVYENLHGVAGGAELTDAIKTRCRKTFGRPGYEFVRKLFKNPSQLSEAKTFLTARRLAYITKATRRASQDGLRPLERATARFATVYAAGCLAIQYAIVNWHRRDLLRAILACQFDSLVSTGPTRPTATESRLRDYFLRHYADFWNLDEAKPTLETPAQAPAPGYRQFYKGENWFYLTSSQLKRIIGTGATARRLKADLVQKGALDTSKQLGLTQRPIYKDKGNRGHRWVHAFRASSFLDTY
ncbi:DUF927 domain-containing protein [Bradyrhizobium symbiodeficiens]|uniref:DUF927 domain-containing protein n=1 Tax=Bradyrhizobium symbiodeficiens TaxID=1404367 RepID=UPI000BA1BE01|nr:DUF927 domain-containing protein [Bradyrhizobium symbiodeficiens]AWM06076.1 DUF927 domain-containing protein [Bradyrhizobium symbiodeficiens]